MLESNENFLSKIFEFQTFWFSLCWCFCDKCVKCFSFLFLRYFFFRNQSKWLAFISFSVLELKLSIVSIECLTTKLLKIDNLMWNGYRWLRISEWDLSLWFILKLLNSGFPSLDSFVLSLSSLHCSNSYFFSLKLSESSDVLVNK